MLLWSFQIFSIVGLFFFNNLVVGDSMFPPAIAVILTPLAIKASEFSSSAATIYSLSTKVFKLPPIATSSSSSTMTFMTVKSFLPTNSPVESSCMGSNFSDSYAFLDRINLSDFLFGPSPRTYRSLNF